jgi:peroxiredoxin
MSYVWDGRRLLVHDPEEYRPWTLYEAPEEHPELAAVTSFWVDPTSGRFKRDCPSSADLGQKAVLGRTVVGYHCGAIHTPQYDRGARDIWVDQATGLLLVDPPMRATAVKENPAIAKGTFSTRPPKGSQVTVFAARRKPDGLPKRAPGFSLERLDGGTARLTDYTGRPVVLAFFDSSIAFDPDGDACRRCIPALLTLQRETSDGTHPAVLAIQGGDKGKPGYPQVPEGLRLRVANDPGFDVEHAYELSEQVAFAFIGSDGKVHQLIDGAATDQRLRAALDRLH